MTWLATAGDLLRGAMPVRLVSPESPHDPEPFEDEQWAPVYSYAPLRAWEGTTPAACAPAHVDPVVFGPPGSWMLQRQLPAPCGCCEAPR